MEVTSTNEQQAYQRLLQQLQGLTPEARTLVELELDEHVQDIKSGEASDINNGGIESQVEYLAQDAGVSVETVREWIESAHALPPPTKRLEAVNPLRGEHDGRER